MNLIVFIFYLLTAVTLNITSIYLHYKIDSLVNAKFTSLTTLTWFTSLILFALLIFGFFRDKKNKKKKKIFNTYEKFLSSLL